MKERPDRESDSSTPAFIISAYRSPDQLVRLVDRLSGDGATFWIHVDRRAPSAVQRTVLEGLGPRSDVTLLPQHDCRWGDFGHVRASLKGIRALLASGRPFDTAVLLTGQCYPVRRRREIDAFFGRQRGRSFLEWTPFPVAGWPGGGWERVERWHFWTRSRCFSFPAKEQFPSWYLERAWSELLVRTRLDRLKRRVPFSERLFGGSGYWCLDRSAVEYVDSFVAARPDFVRFFRRVLCPDEIFFQTILLNSPLAPTIQADSLHFIDWSRPRSKSPKVLGSEDFEALASSTALFARKFDEELDARVLDRIDEELLGRPRSRRTA